jgi:hypothetical protein
MKADDIRSSMKLMVETDFDKSADCYVPPFDFLKL